ncbi:MAG: hypothetical protein IT306_11470, partial [Chloroflexi bacterium]|nr:hypothetical protein [Chloroflexota bacterium]
VIVSGNGGELSVFRHSGSGGTGTATPTSPVSSTATPTATVTAPTATPASSGGGSVVDSASTAITFSGWWPAQTDSSALSGSERIGEFGGDSASHTFTGSSVQVVYRQDTNRGIAAIKIDGTTVGQLDQYGPALAQQKATYSVAPGAHTIQIVVNRAKQSASSGYYVGLDALLVDGGGASSPGTATATATPKATSAPTSPPATATSAPTSPPTAVPTSTRVPTSTTAPATATPASGATTTIDSTSASITWKGWWPVTTDSAAVGGSEKLGEFGGDSASYTFTGSSIQLVYRQNTNRGIAQIKIDGAVVGTLDQYGASTAQKKATYNVTRGSHTIQVVVTRSKQSASSGYYVGIDAFIVTP